MVLRDSKEFFEGDLSVSNDVWRDILLKVRGEVSRKKSFLCGHCQCPIYISGRPDPIFGQKRLHFQHFRSERNTQCIFHEGNSYTHEEIRRMLFNGRQESKEHRELKHIIQDCFIPIVGHSHVFEEPILRGNDGNWRRPDIYVEFPDKNVVFEVQITYIFLSDIIERNLAHRNNGRFVIWIFKDFGEGKGNTLDTERLSKLDIFAANNFNAFVLDKDAIHETKLKGDLHLTVYYRDYFRDNGQIKAKLGKALVAFKDLTFDTERNLIYFFDSERKLLICTKENESQRRIEEEKRIKERERIEAKEEERRFNRYKSFGIIKKMFSSTILSAQEKELIIAMAKSDLEFRQQVLDCIYSFTSQHRRDNSSIYSDYYQNSIDLLTALYDNDATKGKPTVITCLRRCWENLASIASFPGGKDYAVDALFSPSLSNINFKFFDFICSPSHRLMTGQRKMIQEWIREYHNSPIAGKPGKDRYKYFYSWMVLLNDKVRLSNTLTISEAHKLMRAKYKII